MSSKKRRNAPEWSKNGAFDLCSVRGVHHKMRSPLDYFFASLVCPQTPRHPPQTLYWLAIRWFVSFSGPHWSARLGGTPRNTAPCIFYLIGGASQVDPRYWNIFGDHNKSVRVHIGWFYTLRKLIYTVCLVWSAFTEPPTADDTNGIREGYGVAIRSAGPY